MNGLKFLTGSEIALKYGIPYTRVLAAIQTGALPAMKIGNSYVVYETEAQTWGEEFLRNAPPKIEDLQREIATLKSRLERLGETV